MDPQIYHRSQFSKLKRLLNSSSRNVIVIEGARQVGKTTIVEELLKKVPHPIILNLETDLDHLTALDQMEHFNDWDLYLRHHFGFKDQKGTVLFIDEAQESQNLGRFVRSFKERWNHAKVVLTGSSMSRLFRNDQRIPVGRYSVFQVTPFTFQEFLQAGEKQALLDKIAEFKKHPTSTRISETTHQLFLEELDTFLRVGGLPAVIRSKFHGETWQKTRKDILLAQVEDFVRKSNVASRNQLLYALKNIANHLGSPAKYTHIHDRHHTAKAIVEVLENWKLVYEIHQRGNSPTSAFYPKRYVYDIGIAQDLREHPFPTISVLNTLSSAQRTPLGGLLENAFLLEVLNDEQIHEICGWKLTSDQNKEVDFVLKGNAVFPVECKASLKFSKKHLYGVKEYLKSSGLKTGFLISFAPFKVYREDDLKIISLPFYLVQPGIFEALLELIGDNSQK